jgi:serine/threonine protein kinase
MLFWTDWIFLIPLLKLNILIDDGFNPVLSDFGLSRLKAQVTAAKLSSRRTQNVPDRQVEGSLYWMSPEQLRGASLQFASDVYSFGMTVYEVGYHRNAVNNPIFQLSRS